MILYKSFEYIEDYNIKYYVGSTINISEVKHPIYYRNIFLSICGESIEIFFNLNRSFIYSQKIYIDSTSINEIMEHLIFV